MPVRGIPSDYIPVLTLIFSRALHVTPTIRDPGTGYKAWVRLVWDKTEASGNCLPTPPLSQHLALSEK